MTSYYLGNLLRRLLDKQQSGNHFLSVHFHKIVIKKNSNVLMQHLRVNINKYTVSRNRSLYTQINLISMFKHFRIFYAARCMENLFQGIIQEFLIQTSFVQHNTKTFSQKVFGQVIPIVTKL